MGNKPTVDVSADAFTYVEASRVPLIIIATSDRLTAITQYWNYELLRGER